MIMKNFVIKTVLLLSFSPLCMAHDGGHTINSVWQGMLHPITGIDHLLVFLAIGIITAKNTQAKTRLLPLLFVGSMMSGFIISMLGFSFDIAEVIVACSVCLLGVWLVTDKKINTLLLFLVSGLAIAHGYVHGTEVTGGAMHYLLGLVLTAVLLITMTTLAFRYSSPIKNKVKSLFGVAVTAVGLVYILQV